MRGGRGASDWQGRPPCPLASLTSSQPAPPSAPRPLLPGENLYWGSNASTCKVAVDAWMREEATGGGHYTQVRARAVREGRGGVPVLRARHAILPPSVKRLTASAHCLPPSTPLQIVYPATTEVGCGFAACGMVTCTCESGARGGGEHRFRRWAAACTLCLVLTPPSVSAPPPSSAQTTLSRARVVPSPCEQQRPAGSGQHRQPANFQQLLRPLPCNFARNLLALFSCLSIPPAVHPPFHASCTAFHWPQPTASSLRPPLALGPHSAACSRAHPLPIAWLRRDL